MARRPLRYTFILALTALAVTLAAFGGWRFARASAPVNGPIILVSIDSLRADRLPAYGYRGLTTPAVDALAADGVVFERAYAHTPQTFPSHVAMLSGRLPFETGVRDAGASLKNVRLLPQMLRDRGYATGAVVSSSELGRQTGLDAGFDFFDAEIEGAARYESSRDGGASEAIAEHWLDAAGTSRLFLFLHLNEPHRPYASYDDQVADADRVVGRLMKYLKAHQLYDRSTIVLVSDHGEGLGDHGEQAHGLFLYAEDIHVPLIVKPAAGVGAGRRVAEVVQHVDLLPTVLDLVRAPIPDRLPGRSLAPLIDGSGHLGRRLVYAEAMYGRLHFGWSPLRAITDGQHAYIQAPAEELYDLDVDPREQHNIAADREAVRAKMHDALVALAGRLPSGADALADPKDSYEIVERYRDAGELAASRKWAQAIRVLQGIARDDDGIADVWRRIAECSMRLERFDQAADAYARVRVIDPRDAAAALGAAEALLKARRFDDARQRARTAMETNARVAVPAHELLAAIALAQHDEDAAREEASLAHQADPSRPTPAWIEGRLLYDQGSYAEALPSFEQAIADLGRRSGAPIPDLELYTADTLVRLGRTEDAVPHFAAELKQFPANARASAGLATAYHATGEVDEAERVLGAMIEETPTAETYAAAARLWQAFGNPRQAAAIRAEGRKALGGTR